MKQKLLEDTVRLEEEEREREAEEKKKKEDDAREKELAQKEKMEKFRNEQLLAIEESNRKKMLNDAMLDAHRSNIPRSVLKMLEENTSTSFF